MQIFFFVSLFHVLSFVMLRFSRNNFSNRTPDLVYWLTLSARQAFAKVFNQTPDDLDMHLIYDVSHNIAKVEEHIVDGKQKTLLVHRKGA